ncbi:histone deacetylase 8 isoform X2 [Folsomia candida]|uniref:histone deacetylase 8 isoform X2 n=1 Tax=Folsomia candida TaxID=158441 RepID=UPI00160544F4|nr:histone deacetylase 8 isoform X2 [Folsomia candida]
MEKPVYIYNDKLIAASNCIPHLRGRAQMVHELIKTCGLLEFLEMRPPKPATTEDLLTFHSSLYVEFLTNSTSANTFNNDSSPGSEEEEFGLGYDCPTFENMIDFGQTIAGGTIAAAGALIQGSKIAINWCGGWHHAQRDEASGFCYVNDIVIGIQYLMKHFKRVLYIDLDSHHGDGVENAFSYTNRVLTLSLHHYEVGYFPGTGRIQDVGYSRGKYHSVNVPLKSGVVDASFISIVFQCVGENFCADVIVVQCGCDCLSGDPLGNFNLTEKSLTHCVKTILQANLPTIFLGGGGYSLTNAAKTWTALTFTILNREIPFDIPEHDFFLHYGPDFTFQVSEGLRRDENTTDYLATALQEIKENLEKIPKIAKSSNITSNNNFESLDPVCQGIL